jgi:esterase
MTGAGPGRSAYLRLNGLEAHYRHWGDPDKPPVVLLHGLRSYSATWETLADDLARDHWVLALDARGRGESGWDPERRYVTESYVADVEDWVAQLGLTRFALVGHSMGGTTGYVFAARHPDLVERLVVEDIGPGSSTVGPGSERIMREMAETPASFADLEEAAAYWRDLRPTLSVSGVASRLSHTLRRRQDGSWVWRLDMAGIAQARLEGDPARGIDLWRCIEELACPTLVVRGELSDFLSAPACEEMARRQPLLRWTAVEGAGHYAHDDNPEQYVAVVGAFLREPAA